MSANTYEPLENMISAGINSDFPEAPPTEAEFNDKADTLRKALQNVYPVTDEEFEGIKRRLRERIAVQMDIGVYIQDRNNGHQSWLPAKKSQFEFFFWERYKRYLEGAKHWNPRVTASLGQVAEEILDLCGDPSEEAFFIRGLVLGDVQSGKTANYTAICNKAADTGYRLIIVLAGMMENLRQQTQERLDAEFAGRKSEYFLDPKAAEETKNIPVGVGKYCGQADATKKIASFTSVSKDFDSGILRSNNLSLENVNCPVLLVIKKNKRILNNLITWLRKNNTLNANEKIADLPLLLIDDEADNASVNTKDPDSDPTAINAGIRSLLGLFQRVTYLGITATPFANIFIDPTIDEDLFPADFIYTLKPPTDYIGAERIFGENSDSEHMLEEIDMIEKEAYIPTKHKKDLIVDDLPSDMYKAAYYFLLVNAIRDYRGDNGTHRTMMVHVSLYTDVQGQIKDIYNEWLGNVQSALRNYSKLSAEKAEEIHHIHMLHNVWDEFGLSVISGVSWECILHDYLWEAAEPVCVRAVNSKTGAASLDYYAHIEDGLRVIAVGENSMSRGLTLEGLCVSYFFRNTQMYDTLMQMGRWFGYRPNYGDLVKIWLSLDAMDWYGQITRAAEELKDEITAMRNAHQTPRDFGLKVRQDPGTLIVTARNKMRTATQLNQPVTVSGHLLETPRLKSSHVILEENEQVFKAFISKLDEMGHRLEESNERTHGHFFWEKVSGVAIAQFLRDFETHPWHLSFNGRALAEYTEKYHSGDEWDVVLVSSGEGRAYPNPIKCGDTDIIVNQTAKRKVSVKNKSIYVSGTKVRVGSGGCTKIGLLKDEIKQAAEAFKLEKNKKNVPDEAYLIEKRAPILMLHIIEVSEVIDSDDPTYKVPEFLFAIGVGIPKNKLGNRTVTYMANMVEIENWIAPEEEYYDE